MSRYKYLVVLATLLPLSGYAADATTHVKTYENGVKLVAKLEKFVARDHQLKKCGDYVCLIDGKLAYGTDGKVPSVRVSQLIFEKNGKRIQLDTSSMYDPLINDQNFGEMLRVEPYWDDFYKVTGYFSDGAGAYVCQWIVSTSGGTRAHISDVESLFDLASKVQSFH